MIVPSQEYLVTYSDLTADTVRKVNSKYGFIVTDADLPNYLQMLQNDVLMQKIENYTDTGYQYKGSYGDTPNRAIPNYIKNVKNVNDCLNVSKERGYSVVGLQYYGQCWGGNSESRAYMYGKQPSRYPLGVGWNNEVYVRHAKGETNIQFYDDFVSWMVNNGIKDYETIKTIVNLNVELFTTASSIVEGATTESALKPETPPLDQSNMITPSTNGNIRKQTTHILSDISGLVLIKPLDNAFIGEIRKIQNKSLVSKFIKLMRLNINKYTPNNTTPITEIPSTYIVNVTNVLSVIGYKRSSDNLYDVLSLLNKFGVFTSDILKPGFTTKYTQFGMNSQSNLVEIIIKLEQYKIQDIADANKLTFNAFKEKGLSVIGLNAGNLFEFSELIHNFYNPTGMLSDFVSFLQLIVDFDPSASVNMDRLRLFRDTLIKYGTNFSEYKSLHQQYLRAGQVKILGIHKKAFFEKFVNYYNKYSKTNATDIIPIGNAVNANTISLYSGISNFFNVLKSQNFKITNAFDFNSFLDDIISIKIQLNDIHGNVFKKKYSNYFESFTGYGKEGFSVLNVQSDRGNKDHSLAYTSDVNTREGFVENLENGYADSLRLLGFTDVNQMPVYLSRGSTEISMINGYDLDNKLRQTIGVTNSDAQYIVLSYLSQITMPGNQIYIMVDLLKQFNVTMQNFKEVSSAFNRLYLTDYDKIMRFLTIIIPFGVTFQTLKPFSDQVNKFKVNIKNTEAFFDFLNTMRVFDIIYKPSIYDNCNTKFSNFVYNFTYDNLDYTHFNSIILPLLKVLNDGVIPTFSDITSTEKLVKINHNMRDVIIRKDKLFYGIDNPVQANDKSLIGNCYNGTLNVNPNYSGNFSSFASNNYASTLTANKQFIRFIPLYTLSSGGKPAPLAMSEKDNVTTFLTTSKTEINTKLFKFEKVISLLTTCQYTLMKTQNPPNLVERSVMSRLLSLLITEIKPPEGATDKDIVANYNAYVNTINIIRFMPYKAFKLIANEIYSNNSYNNQTLTNKYDVINSYANRTNSSNTFLPVIQECKGMAF
jgi:hypothetical protein